MVHKNSKGNIYIVLLMVIYVFSQNILYLMPVSNAYNLFAYLLLLLLTGYVIFILNKGKMQKSNFTFLMVCPFVLSFVAAIVETFYYNDANAIIALYRQMQWWIYGLVFIIVYQLLIKEHLSHKRLLGGFVIVGIIQCIIGIAQYIVRDDIVFTYAPTTERLGEVRFYFPVVLMVFLFFWALNNFFKGTRKLFSICTVIAVLFEVTFVQQFRATLVGMLIATMIGFFIWEKASYKKLTIFIVAIIAVYAFYLRSTFLQQSVAYLLDGDTSMNVRQYLIDFILENAQSRPLLGSGWVSSNQAYAYASTPYKENINWGVFAFADGGIFSILYSYGVGGIVWVAILWWRMLNNGWTLIKRENEYLYFLFPLYMLATMYIDIHWYIHDQFFVLALFCAISEYRIHLSNMTVNNLEEVQERKKWLKNRNHLK